MKKLTKIVMLALAAAAASAMLVFASGENTVISLSYLNGTYGSQLAATLKTMTSELQPVYDAALEKLAQKTGQETSLGGNWNSTTAFEMVYPRAGETVTLSAGSGLVWYSGTGSASAVLVDVTAGTELSAGRALTAGHRYLAEQETVVTASASSSCGAEGMWRTTATGTAPVQSPYQDVTSGDWYYDAVIYVTENGLMIGDAGKFDPDGPTTRGMIMTILARLEGVDTSGGSPWYQKGMEWAVAAGVSDGTNPDRNIPREQLITMLWRYVGEPASNQSLDAFPDASKISSYAVEAMKWAVETGVIQGSDGLLIPTATTPRCQIAVILMRFCENIVK